MISLLKLLRKTEKTGKSVEEAIALAVQELHVDSPDDLEITVLEEAAKGFLGIGSKDAKISAEIKNINPVLASTFLKNVFDAMNLEVDIQVKDEGDVLKIELSGDRMGIVIGKRGETLDSLQYLTSLIVNRENDDYIKVILDTENYRAKRETALLALADRLAQKVAKTSKKYTLEPMNPYERRIIHAHLQDHADVTTFSVGEDPYRKVVIAPKNAPQTTRRSSYSYHKAPAPHREFKKAESFEEYQAGWETEE